MAIKSPPHPGLLIKEDVMAPLGLSLIDASTKFDADANYLAAVIAGQAAVNIELARNLEKEGVSTAKMWIALQNAFDQEGKA